MSLSELNLKIKTILISFCSAAQFQWQSECTISKVTETRKTRGRFSCTQSCSCIEMKIHAEKRFSQYRDSSDPFSVTKLTLLVQTYHKLMKSKWTDLANAELMLCGLQGQESALTLLSTLHCWREATNFQTIEVHLWWEKRSTQKLSS